MSNVFDLAFLHAHGIGTTPAALNEALVAAVKSLPATLYDTAEHDLTQGELAALREGGMNLTPLGPGERDPLAETIVEYASLIKSSMTVKEVASLLGVDPSRVRQRLTESSLYGFHIDGAWLVPRFQFQGSQLLPNLGNILRRLSPDLHPVIVCQWFLRDNPDLEDPDTGGAISPRDWLLAGHSVEPLAFLAENV